MFLIWFLVLKKSSCGENRLMVSGLLVYRPTAGHFLKQSMCASLFLHYPDMCKANKCRLTFPCNSELGHKVLWKDNRVKLLSPNGNYAHIISQQTSHRTRRVLSEEWGASVTFDLLFFNKQSPQLHHYFTTQSFFLL